MKREFQIKIKPSLLPEEKKKEIIFECLEIIFNRFNRGKTKIFPIWPRNKIVIKSSYEESGNIR